MTSIEAAAMFMPMVKALVLDAEGNGGTGADKAAAVAAGAALQYKAAQAAIPALQAIPWEYVEPLVIQVETGLITVIVRALNALKGKIWGMFAHAAPAVPVAA